MVISLITGMIVFMFMMFMNMNEMEKIKKNMKSPFECGFNQMSMKKTTFSTNFLLISMMFLIFDVEISYLMPTIMENKMKTMMIIISVMFLAILTVVLMKEWKQGSLEWNK